MTVPGIRSRHLYSFLLTLFVVPGVGVEPTFTYQQGRDALSQGVLTRVYSRPHLSCMRTACASHMSHLMGGASRHIRKTMLTSRFSYGDSPEELAYRLPSASQVHTTVPVSRF